MMFELQQRDVYDFMIGEELGKFKLKLLMLFDCNGSVCVIVCVCLRLVRFLVSYI